MNLDVNFVHNRRMQIGDYKTAAGSFEEVVERYGKHAFGHYFLAEAYKALAASSALIRKTCSAIGTGERPGMETYAVDRHAGLKFYGK